MLRVERLLFDLADPGVDVYGYDVPFAVVAEAIIVIALVALLLIVYIARRRRARAGKNEAADVQSAQKHSRKEERP